MRFDISPGSPVPIYRQIVEQVRRLVAGGQCQAGDELPSVRAVALEHAVNPMTVSKAYSLLEAEGLLVRRRGMGMVVADRPGADALAQCLDLIRPSLEASARQARQLGLHHAQALALFDQALRAQGLEGDTPHDPA